MGQEGLVAATTSLTKNLIEGDATPSDVIGFASAFGQVAVNMAKIGAGVNPFLKGAQIFFLATDIANLLYQYFSCEPPKKETPTTDPAQRQTSPLVIDLGFNGIETLASNRGIYFDLDNNGFAENTAWVRYTDGLLALDLNNNGLIDNGSELFGNHFVLQNGQKAANGFEALKEFDTDGNMSIDHLDEIWSRLKIWQDLNRDGITQEGELKDLNLSGIQAINLNYLEKDNFDSNGNNHRQQSTVQWHDGKTSSINDVWLNVNLADTIELNGMRNISDELQAILNQLPNVQGFGNLSHLQIAMARNPALLEKVQHYLNSDFETRKTLINDLIYEWAGCIDADPKSRDPKSHYGHVIDARKVITLEILTGHGYVGTWCSGKKDPNPHGQAAPLLAAEFNKFADYVSSYLSAQSEYADIFEDFFHSTVLNMGNSSVHQYSDVLNNKIETLLKMGDFLEIKKILNVAEHLGAYNAFIRNAWSNELQVLKSHFAELKSLFDDTFFNGTDGNDTVYGKNTDDFLIGGLGNDQLYGKEGSDIYAFGQNFGRDKIYDNKGQDTVVFIDSNIKPENIIMRRVKESFNSIELIEIDDLGHESGNRIQIDSFFDFNGNLAEGAIEIIRFNDDNKTTWDIEIIKDKLLSATENDQHIYGYSGADLINGGKGNDILSGNLGSDTYVFTPNFGNDNIIEVDADNSIRFEGIRADELKFYRDRSDLIIKQIGTDNQITVRNQFNDKQENGHPHTQSQHISKIVFDDGTV